MRRDGRPKLAVAAPRSTSVPELPPAEVLDALDTAARVLSELDRKDVSIRIEHDYPAHELRVLVTDNGGKERSITPTHLLNVLAGDVPSIA